jgi:glycerol-3-phosphate dehydrogenase
MYDVIIIGAGVIGALTARELSRYELDVLVLEKESDVSCGASKANSGIIHGGFDAKHGKIKSEFVREGNQLFDELEEELNFGFRRCGSFVLAFSEEERQKLLNLYDNGIKNGVNDLSIIDRESVLKLEPHINPDVKYALHCPSAGVASPYELVIAAAENAVTNGVHLLLNHEVLSISSNVEYYSVHTQNMIFQSRVVINSTGVNSDKVAQMVGDNSFSIIPRRGEYILLNKSEGRLLNKVLFQAPKKNGKGILVTKTFHGNLMLGPNAQEILNPDDVSTNLEILEQIVTTARKTLPSFDIKKTIRSYAGIRATSSTYDFVIGRYNNSNFINAAGIDSPGLTSSPAIAKYLVRLVEECGLNLKEKKHFDPNRKAIIVKKQNHFGGSIDNEDPSKNIICRCEIVTEAEIIDALSRGLYVDSLDAVKRRTRAGMGPCQGTFCGPRVSQLISKNNKIPIEKVTQRGKGSSSLPHREDKQFWKKLEKMNSESL